MNTYPTTDFYLCSFLRAAGFPMIDTERDGYRLTFVFANTAALQTQVERYFNGTATVAPNAMAAAIRDLKSMIHRG